MPIRLTFHPIRVSSVVLAILLCTSAASAQTTPNGSSNGKIYLDVVVSPKSGAPVGDLQQQDFTILDNKVPQAPTSFQAVNGRQAPIEVILVIDTVNTTYQNVGYERIEIDKFLRAEGGRLAYPMTLAVFSDKGIQLVGDFSSDGNALSGSLDRDDIGLRTIRRDAGYFGASQRLELSLNALGQLATTVASSPQRKIILWLSPGWPFLSGPGMRLDQKDEQQIFGNVARLTDQLMQAHVTLYSIDPLGANESVGRTLYYQAFLKGLSKPDQAQLGNLGLQVLAIQSGGLALSSTDVAGRLRKCLQDSVPYYEISYDAPAARQPNEYHHVEVKLDKHDLTARTREGYYAQP